MARGKEREEAVEVSPGVERKECCQVTWLLPSCIITGQIGLEGEMERKESKGGRAGCRAN